MYSRSTTLVRYLSATVGVIAVLLALPSDPAHAGEDLTFKIDGTCPGPEALIGLEVRNGSSQGELSILAAKNTGSFIPQGGPCPGLEFGLQNPILIDTVTLTPAGRLDTELAAVQSACGGVMRVLDNETCTISEVAAIPDVGDKLFDLEEIATGVKDPSAVASPNDGTGRLMFVSQRGQVSVFEDGKQLPELFLNLSAKVECCFEQGLIGFAFHPDYASNGTFFVHYTEIGTGDSIIARFRTSDDPNVADAASEKLVLRITQPFNDHNGGQLAFGPDGYLYLGIGDGGMQGDPDSTGQDVSLLLAKILRIDIDIPGPNGERYSIPPDNPLIGFPGAREEIWAVGLRNPWRFSFDRENGDLIIGDVGQEVWEEVNVQPGNSTGGENYGWSRMEGSECFKPEVNCDAAGTLVKPTIEYKHFFDGLFNGCAVIGGFVYRGEMIPDLVGTYLYADWCTGTVWGATNDGGEWTTEIVMRTRMNITTFAEDEDGEMLIAEYRRNADEGFIYRLVPVTP